MMISRWLFVALLSILAGCATQNDGRQAYVAEDTSRTIDLTHPPRDMWDRIRRGFAIPNLNDERATYWTNYYASHPQSVLLMSQRAGKYLYYIVDELDQRGMPTELALLPFVESAYDPNALSRSKASGLWQFIPSTGQHYNLQQDIWRDLRRDPVASTQAALDYLAYLYDLQGDWYLALASYNWGEGAVRRAIEKAGKQGARQPTYLTLDLPDEPRNYVPKLQAIKNIIARPEKFGVTLPKVGNTPYFTTVHKSRDMDLAVAAALAEMPFEEFQALNPSFNKPLILGAHNPPLHLPLDKVSTFDRNLDTHHGPLATWTLVPVRKGQSLAAIAKAHGITLSQLRSVNGLSARQTVAGTTPLLVPSQAEPIRSGGSIGQTDVIARLIADAQSAPARPATPRTHTIRKGDTLFALARRYNTSVAALRELNNLKDSRLATGKPLRIPANQ
ncbi:transglycosylase SLT domain-containing protein [Castellaniella sp.]|uniref:transglycosylase SLT domain-containing protein n=1 Tax=Castellaniella sp. TaxID=1955812 RepID=UPI00356AEBF5